MPGFIILANKVQRKTLKYFTGHEILIKSMKREL